MEGSLASLATTLRDKFGITVKTVAISNNKQMVKALSNGTIDVALPLFRDYWLAEQKGVVQSNPMGTVSLTAIHSSNNLNRDLKKSLARRARSSTVLSSRASSPTQR